MDMESNLQRRIFLMKYQLLRQHTKKDQKAKREAEKQEKKQPKDKEWLENHGRSNHV